jgi:hypothetical protein
MRSLAYFLYLFLSGISIYAQNSYFSIKKVKSNNDFSFPIVSDLNGSSVSMKINQLLQISELEVLRKSSGQNIFKKTSTNNYGLYGNKVAISYAIQTNSNKLLSIKFNQASCGMTCHYWVRYYNFNAQNGDILQLKDMFTEAGYRKFYHKVAKKRIKELREEIKKLDKEVQADFKEIESYYADDDLNDFYIKNGNLYIDGDNSFHKNLKFSGIETVCVFKSAEFKGFLNPYGKSIFNLNNQPIKEFHSRSLPQLYKGKIAGKNVLMVINKGYKNEIRAEYVYLRYADGIFLTGQLNGTTLSLSEKNKDYNDIGFIKAEFKNNQIEGTWKSKQKDKVYKVSLNRT